MSVEDLASRLDKVLDLSARATDIPERQRTLRQTMDWSYAQLPPSAADVFPQLGVFAGSFSLHAAEAIVACEQGVDILDVLSVLGDHSLLRPDLDTDGTRFSMLEIVAEYARTRLDPATRDALSERHARYYRGVAAEAFTGLRGASQHAMIARLDRDVGDIAAALDWLLSSGQLVEVADMCWSLWLYYWLRNSVTEGRRWTRGALDTNGSLPRLQRGRLLAADAFLAAWRRDYAMANDELTEALEIAGTERDDDLQLLTSIMLIIVHGGLGDEARARQMAERARQLARSHNDRWSEAVALSGLSWLNAAVGRFDEEVPTFEAMVEAAHDAHDPLWTSLAEDNMAELLIWQGRHTEAAVRVIESIRQLAALRMAYAGVGSLNTAAWLLSRVGDWQGAVQVQTAADSIMERMNAGLWPLWLPRRNQLLDEARQQLSPTDFEAAVTSGEPWSFEEAAAQCISLLTAVAGDACRVAPGAG
jgi:tetratricopeptide (TPR) repeat protein